ncbi:MAG: hypothetical protein OMM_15022 [Candidatus Magnetoglobus multicellularis str. Araruama]|uniref:Uncharacterized protein n=1 Tax=Candidatus Magnetoglobus multicellularis str. Araruama TaxID=890399 RepID=A0A1V1NR51_9BACT|nr:MAG: hypothetical protein OMM_15022 [Candidatus Magnetoglobus multicellularis str. Araruama]
MIKIPQISYRFSTTEDSTLQPMTGIDNNSFMFSIPQPDEGWGILSDQILYYTITCKDVAGNTSYFKGSEYINPIDGPFLTCYAFIFRGSNNQWHFCFNHFKYWHQ